MDKCHFKIKLKKLKTANFAVFYIKAISNNIDSHDRGRTLCVIGLLPADRLSVYRLIQKYIYV